MSCVFVVFVVVFVALLVGYSVVVAGVGRLGAGVVELVVFVSAFVCDAL